MPTLTIHLSDEKHSRLKALAQSRGISVSQLMEELSTLALAELDAKTRFQALAMQGNVVQGLEILARLDHLHQS
jgi:predicted transcriptional regulator